MVNFSITIPVHTKACCVIYMHNNSTTISSYYTETVTYLWAAAVAPRVVTGVTCRCSRVRGTDYEVSLQERHLHPRHGLYRYRHQDHCSLQRSAQRMRRHSWACTGWRHREKRGTGRQIYIDNFFIAGISSCDLSSLRTCIPEIVDCTFGGTCACSLMTRTIS